MRTAGVGWGMTGSAFLLLSVFMRCCSEGATGMTVCRGKENKALELCIVETEMGRAEGTWGTPQKRGPTQHLRGDVSPTVGGS